MKKYFLSTIIMLSVIITESCNQADKEKEQEVEVKIEDTTLLEQNTKAEENVYYTLPSPLQIAYVFKKAGLTYKPGLVINTSDIEKYTTKEKQLLIMGIYIADMAYCVLNDQTQGAMNYLNAINQLSEKLWRINIISSELYKKYEKNVINKDSLATIIADIQMSMDDYLENNKMNDAAVIIFTGAWQESVFLASQTTNLDNKTITSRLSEQLEVLESILKLLEKNKEIDVNFILNDLKEIKNIMLPTQNNEELSTEQIQQLKEKIKNLRFKILT